MTELDTALEKLRQNMNDPRRQSGFYDIFLNGTFFVPTLMGEAADQAGVQDEQVLPLIMESDGNDYLMLFDTRERLTAWSETAATFVEVPGHVLAATSMPPLHWALNVGTDYSKQFTPDEIAWLRDAVERCNAAAAEENGAEQPAPLTGDAE
jgi:hypothetical protein